MLKFFRRIRKRLIHQERVQYYLLYAVGEIILVVLGILLALQINNWNTERVEQNQMQEFASAMIQDLRADIYETELRQKQMEKIGLLCLTWNLYYRPFQWNRSTMEQYSTGVDKKVRFPYKTP